MNILIADDHDLVRTGLAQLLRSEFPESVIFEAASSKEIVAQKVNDIDLVLLDLDMPGIVSVKKVGEICVQFAGTAIIVVSGNESPYMMNACMDVGAMGFIPKSSPNQVLLNAIQLVISGMPYVPYKFIDQERKTARTSSYKLTARQEEIFALLIDGLTNEAIAAELGVTEGTIKQHLFTLYKSLKVNNRMEAIQKAKGPWN